MSNTLTRRRFLFTAGAAAAVAHRPSIFGLSSAPLTRRNLANIAPDHPILVSFRKAIKSMKALPASDPLSWDYQAAIYGTGSSASHVAWNTRQLGNHFFWSWHRMYLYWFERVVRRMSGDATWALPFWDSESPTQRTLPAAFRDSQSELYTPNRGAGWNDGSASFPASHVSTIRAMQIGGPGYEGRAFFTAGEVFESNPHNTVHIDIGGWMGSPLTAAQDPVFFVHTANIDRLWNLWLAQGGAMRNDPLFLDAWKNKPYTFFDENRKEVHMTGCDVMRCAEQLNYIYEGEPPQMKQYCPKSLPALSIETWLLLEGPPLVLGGESASVSINFSSIRKQLPRLLESKDSYVSLDFSLQAASAPAAVWEVYLKLPESDYSSFLGTVCLFSRAVLAHAGQPGPDPFLTYEDFHFHVGRELKAALLGNRENVIVEFVPTGPLVNGKPSQPAVRATARSSHVNLGITSFKEPD
jgi:tyrosinase